MTEKDLLAKIDSFLADTGMGWSTFGQECMNDRHLVSGIRKGRRLFGATIEKILKYIADERRKRRLPERTAPAGGRGHKRREKR